MKEELLKQRKAIKRKKPEFIRQDSHKKARINKSWRRPKGIHSKMRLKRPGYRRSVGAGYGAPAGVRGLSREGLVPVIVKNAADLEKIGEGQAAVISSSVGQRKKIEMLNKAKESGIKVLNIKNIDEYLKAAAEKIEKKKEEKKKTAKEKEKKKEEKEKKAKEAEKKEDLAEKLSDEEKKEKEKKERDKVLIKKGS